MRSRSGFTLVELAIVLVIIGLILGAVLKGKSLIDNARVKRLEKDTKGLEAAVWTFYDRYGRFPGDCNKDGIIDATTYNAIGGLNNNPSAGFCQNTNADYDRDRPWAELKEAMILPVSSDNRDLARNIFNGMFYIGRVRQAGTTRPWYNGIAIVDIPCFAAKSIDQSIDGVIDGTSGSVRILVSYYEFANSTNNNYDSICTTENTPIDIVYLFDKTP